jgi:hypothetical protein
VAVSTGAPGYILVAQYPDAPLVGNDDINLMFARNITSYFNPPQQALIPQ